MYLRFETNNLQQSSMKKILAFQLKMLEINTSFLGKASPIRGGAKAHLQHTDQVRHLAPCYGQAAFKQGDTKSTRFSSPCYRSRNEQ